MSCIVIVSNRISEGGLSLRYGSVQMNFIRARYGVLEAESKYSSYKHLRSSSVLLPLCERGLSASEPRLLYLGGSSSIQ